MVKNITIYTTNTCSSCGMVKRYLDTKGLQYEVINVEENPSRQAEAISASGVHTVPVTVVTKTDDSQAVVVGYNLQQLAPALV